jgi:hypothetical protein
MRYEAATLHALPFLSFSRRWRAFGATAMAMTLAACGGGGGGGDGGAPVPPTRASGPFEFSQCNAAPSAIRIVREQEAGGWRTNRYVAASAGEPLAKMVPQAGPTGKNPEGVVSHGPLQAQNCTPGTGATQTMRFKLHTEGFFSTQVADHLSIGLRAFYPTANRENEEAYDAIGLILHPAWGGVLAERFRRPGGNAIGPADAPGLTVQDGVTYIVELEAGTLAVRYRVRTEGGTQDTGWKSYSAPADFAPLQGTGFLIAVLCSDDNARCEAFDRPFRIDITELAAGWM